MTRRRDWEMVVRTNDDVAGVTTSRSSICNGSLGGSFVINKGYGCITTRWRYFCNPFRQMSQGTIQHCYCFCFPSNRQSSASAYPGTMFCHNDTCMMLTSQPHVSVNRMSLSDFMEIYLSGLCIKLHFEINSLLPNWSTHLAGDGRTKKHRVRLLSPSEDKKDWLLHKMGLFE